MRNTYKTLIFSLLELNILQIPRFSMFKIMLKLFFSSLLFCSDDWFLSLLRYIYQESAGCS